ncbi:MAG TPA: hypothetical protein DCR78_14620 [Pseudomonas sp.]|nr:hypothetical protein [Stutzerimonas xanthomarina]HAQ87659.1 hypothetical protein [Pseudomonas sp.]HAW26299.1 hypothetical protein [Pseudomonas sp.]HCC63242.1 hypothetical protein [Pseudomonas sp.]
MTLTDAVLAILLAARIHGTDDAIKATAKRPYFGDIESCPAIHVRGTAGTTQRWRASSVR